MKKDKALRLAIESIDQVIYQIPWAIYQTTNTAEREQLYTYVYQLKNARSVLVEELETVLGEVL